MASTPTSLTPPVAPQPGGALRADRVGVREVLLAAWYLGRRNLILMLWHWLTGVATTLIALVTAAVVVLALLVPAREHEMASLFGLLGYGLDVFERVQRPGFVAGLFGLLATALALAIATTAAVHGAIYGRLAGALRPDGRKTGLWRCATRWFAPMVGYTALRMLLEVALAGVALALVAWPLLSGLEHVALTDRIPVPHALFAALGLAVVSVLWGLLWAWRMIALGPLMLEERPLFAALGDAALHLGTHLGRWLHVLGGLALIVAPIVLIYGAFAIMLGGLSSDPQLARVASFGALALDAALGVAMSVVFVFAGAAFLVQYAWRQGLLGELPTATAPRPPAAALDPGARTPLRFGQPLMIPGLPAMVVMPIPTSHPNIVRFDDILPPLERDGDDDDTPDSPPQDAPPE